MRVFMHLSLFKRGTYFPDILRDNLLDIIDFVSKAKDDKIEEVLYDNKISIDITDLKAIKENEHYINIENINMPNLTLKLKDIGIKELSNEEIDFFGN